MLKLFAFIPYLTIFELTKSGGGKNEGNCPEICCGVGKNRGEGMQ